MIRRPDDWSLVGVTLLVFGGIALLAGSFETRQLTTFAWTWMLAGTHMAAGVAAGFGSLSDLSKWVCVIAMLLGRLEIFTLLVLISPTFWEH